MRKAFRSFKVKIALLLGVAVLGMVSLSALSVWQLRTHIFEGRRDQLTTAVAAAHSIVAAYQDQAAQGRLPVAEAQKLARDALRSMRFGAGNKDYIYIWTTDGGGVMHPFKPEWDGQPMLGKVKDGNGVDIVLALVEAMKRSADGTAFVPTNFPRPGSQTPVPKLQYVVRVKGWDWMVGAGLYTDDVDAEMRSALVASLGLMLAVIAAVGAAGALIARGVLRQIGGEPAAAVAAMHQVAGGNLAVSFERPAPGSLMAELDAMVQSLRAMVGDVRHSTDSIATASAQIASGSLDLSGRTEQTASNLQQTAATMEELTGTVSNTSKSARAANEVADAARASATQGGAVVGDVVATMQKITDSSKRIADIIGVIDGIAFQTNIIALNAAVESARAGEQGRGFAVVASEVRSLAQRSAQAAKEIKDLIGESVERVEAGAALVNRAGESMRDIVASVERVGTIIDEITRAAHEQSEGIGQVNTAVSELDRATQQNAALVEQSTAAAESLKDQARRLSETVQAFRLEPLPA
jgi:methyl-accepting chemotaxis protein